MQKLQESVFSIVKTTNLSQAVFSFLQPSEDSSDKTPLGGILNDTRHGWLALGPKFCVVDLKSGLKVAAKTFGTPYSNSRTVVTSVIELPTPLTDNSKQLIISISEDITSTICIFHMNGSQTLCCIQTDLVVTELAVCDVMPNGPFSCFDGVVMAGTKSGEIFVFDLNRAGLIQAMKDISQGYEHLIQNESNPANLTFLPLNAVQHIEEQRDLALENNDHLAVLLNDMSVVEGQYIFYNPDGTVRMKTKSDQVKVTVLQYIPQLGSLAVGYNFGAFQIWNLLTLELEYTSQVNVECVPVTHFGFQEPCDDPRAFCYLWVVYSVTDKFDEEEFPVAVMYSLTYHGKRMLSDTKCLYQEFSMASIRFQVELTAMEDAGHLIGGKCVSCHTYSINYTLGSEGEDSMLNICQLVWECWGESPNSSQYGMLLFDLDQWYKDQMPETYRLQSNPFMSATWCSELSGACALDARLSPASVAPYSHCTRLEEHFYPNSLQYQCVCLTTSDACVLGTVGIQRQIISSLESTGPTALLNPPRLYRACLAAGLTPLYTYQHAREPSQEEQRKFLLSVALEARLSRFLKRCAHDWATGAHAGAGCTLPYLVDWCWQRAIELKENAKELTAPLFSSAALPDRNVVRCLEHCVQQLSQLTGLLDAILTKCCNLVVPDALSEMEEKYKGIGTVSLYFQVVQWFLRVGLLPERHDAFPAAPYPAKQLYAMYSKRRLKLQRLLDNSPVDDPPSKSCTLLYIDQLIENEFGGERIHQMWIKGGSQCNGLYPPPSLYSLLRLYLVTDVSDEHKHALVLYLLLDYSVLLDQVQYEAVIRRLMQFPTMFGLSNTAIKATQAFWHLDHRDFDFALDQLQCLTGNTLSEWQHNVVLSSLLAQKKTQAALQYLHVRKPAPIQIKDDNSFNKVNDHDKLEDWQSCCSLYLARGLVFEALDVIRMCVQNAGSLEDKMQVLNYFFKGCRNSGQLSKILQSSLLPLEEEVFIKYLQNCNESQTSDILVMYYLQQARYIEAEQYNSKLRHSKTRAKDPSGSIESLAEVLERESARDTIVEIACASLPQVTNAVRDFALCEKDIEPHVIAPKPMSVFVKARSPKNTFTYRSSFIQDTIENASETWINKPTMRRGLKRALNVEETPFICTPKLNRIRSVLTDQNAESTPPKRAKLDLNATPKTPKFGSAAKVNDNLSKQISILLDMPEVQSPECKLYVERSGAGTPHSILKIRRSEMDREAPSPVDSRYLGESDDDMLETCSNHTHFSDKHLRFTIPTASESGSTPSPPAATVDSRFKERDTVINTEDSTAKEEREENTTTTDSHAIDETHPLESPPKKVATEESVKFRKSYKDTVKARRSLSISANSSLNDDPSSSIESIADIPITLINPRYSTDRRRELEREREDSVTEMQISEERRNTINPRFSTERQRELEREREDSVTEMQVSEERRDTINPRFSTEKRRELEREREDSVTEMQVTESEKKRDTVHPRFSIERQRELERERGDSVTEMQVTEERRNTINPRYSTERRRELREREDSVTEMQVMEDRRESLEVSVPRTVKGRRGIRDVLGDITPPNRSRSVTPERCDSPLTPHRRNVRARSRTPELSPALAPIPEARAHEAVAEPHPAATLTSVRRLRSRSRTPERIEKVLESPRLEPISESPTKSSNTDSSSSPSRRSLRSRSRTPEVEIPAEQIRPASPRSLRSRAKTPEKIMSPKLEHSVRSKKSLSRIVLEANAFAKSKMNVEQNEKQQAEAPESAIECTPVKTLKQVSSLMDVTLSPIVNKSVLQSSTDSMLSETVGQETTIVEDKSVAESGLKTLPPFTTLHESYFEKSVLQSYQSSVTDTLGSMQEDNSKVEETGANASLKSLPSFATVNDMGLKSVLHSYQSSVADTSESMQEDNKVEESLKPLPAFTTTINELEMKSVLHSCESSIAETSHSMQEERVITVTKSVEINIEKSVLQSHESSIGKSSQEGSMSNVKDGENSALKDVSLITNDSDVEMKDVQVKVWKTNIDSQETASVIQKEKERIVDIEREINELEGDMTDDNSDSEQGTSSDEEIVEAPESDESNPLRFSSEESSDESTGSDDEEIISIQDTDSDQSSSSEQGLQIDEDQSSSEPEILGAGANTAINIEIFAEVNVESKEKETPNVSSKEVGVKDPLDQTSIMTDDNSVAESEKSEANVKPIASHFKDTVEDINTKKNVEIFTEVNVEPKEEETPIVSSKEVGVKNPLDQASIMTEDNSVAESEKSQANVKSIASHVKDTVENVPMEIASNVEIAIKDDIEKVEDFVPKDIEIVDIEENLKSVENKAKVDIVKNKHSGKVLSMKMQTESDVNIEKQTDIETTKQNLNIAETSSEKKTEDVDMEKKSEAQSEIVEESVQQVPKTKPDETKEDKEVESQKESFENQVDEESTKPATRTRKRAKSTSSNKSITESKSEDVIEPRTPATRKRTQSNASNKSIELKTPENEVVITRRRAKTPTSTEVRKIITRRASKEISEKMEDSRETLDDSIAMTPKRRSARSKSKNDDNESVASESSVKSTRSKASEDAGDVKPSAVRKGRKSILTTKPDLSVIPEMIVEEDSKGAAEDTISEYSNSRRLTRHQKAVLESWLEPGSPRASPRPRARARRPSAASSRASDASHDDDDASSTASGFDVQPIDRISLLNKQDFEGSPDTEDLHSGSPDSFASEASRQRRSRLGRAASESKVTPKTAKSMRRISVDVAESPDRGSPVGGAGSATRGRRASFNKACEALHTPKGRRQSTDARKEADSPVGSEAEATPARRSRRAASTHSNTSQAKADTGRRSKKTTQDDKQ